MDTTQPNSQPGIRTVRQRAGVWQVTKADGSTFTVPVVNRGSYTSRVSFGYSGGILTVRQVKP